ncbi:zinc finger protein 184-like [Topomyia yanbarensis]|uniref:zinc finger protein 184-like n=1 Tax=Topomyia yanbarensis TaxID=2498891 RepID=UPI00273B60F7|nr:zinc finger protein 184-like [Topomyia yanbarensis]
MSINVGNYMLCCRVCLETEKSELFLSMYDTHPQGFDVNLQTAFQKITGIECIEDEYLPSKICQSCHLRLQDAYNFILECCNNNSLLHALKEDALRNEQLDEESLDVQVVYQNEQHPEETIIVRESKSQDTFQIDCFDEKSFQNVPAACKHLVVESDVDLAEHQSVAVGDSQSSGAEEERLEDATDAVDFILKNFQKPNPTRKRIRQQQTARRHKCEVCNKSFQRKSNLVDHLRLHANVKLFSCNYCDAAFVQAGNLKSHIRKHTLEKPYECDTCGKSYSQSSALKTHIRSHTNTRNYICDVCQKGFTNSSDLGKHKVTHTDLRFFQCVLCHQRYFTQKIHLKKHLTSYHASEDQNELLRRGILKEGVRIGRMHIASRSTELSSDE